MKCIRVPLVLLLWSIFTTASHAQSTAVDTAALLAPAHRFLDSFNAHADTVPTGIFTDDAVTLDVIPPYVWAGPQAVRRWYTDLLGRTSRTSHANDLVRLDQHLQIGSPGSIQVVGDVARFVLPAVATYVDQGKRQRQIARWVIAERRQNNQWRISVSSFDVTG